MAYIYNPGDGLAVLDAAEPNGATEPVSILDDAVKQIKAYLKDATVGPEAKIAALQTIASAGGTGLVDRVTTLEGNNGKKAIITRVGAQSVIGGSGIAVINFDSEEVDSAGAFSIVTHQYTAPITGLYLVAVQLTVTKSASAAPTGIIHQLDVFVDAASGAFVKEHSGTNEDPKTLQFTRMFNLTVGQTLSAKYTLTLTGGSMTVDLSTDPRDTIFQICLIAK